MVLFLRAPIPLGNPRISWVTQGRFYTRGADKSLCGKHSKRSAGSSVLETRNWNRVKTVYSMNSNTFKRAQVVKMLKTFWSITCNPSEKQLRTLQSHSYLNFDTDLTSNLRVKIGNNTCAQGQH